MKVRHSVPADEFEDHLLDLHCPCHPDQTVIAAPGKRPVATLTHQPFRTTRSNR